MKNKLSNFFIIRHVFQKSVCAFAIIASVFLLLLFLLTAMGAFLPFFESSKVAEVSQNHGVVASDVATNAQFGVNASPATVKATHPATNAQSPANARNIRLVKSLIFTIEQAFCSTIIALLVGIPVAYFVACKKFPFKRFLKSLSGVSLCIPPLLIALGYVMCFGMNGILNKTFTSLFGTKEPIFTFLYSFLGIIIAQGFYNFPVVMGTVSTAWENLSQERHDAALLCGASKPRIFFTVTLPELTPSICSSAIIVFLYCFFSFMIVLLFGAAGCSTMEVEIYQAAKNTLDFAFASKLALVETFFAILIVSVYVLLSQKSRKISDNTLKIEPTSLKSPISVAFFAIILLIITVFLLIPLALIFVNGFPKLQKVFSQNGFLLALTNTLFVGFFASFFAVVIALTFAIFARKIDPLKKSALLKVAPLIPMAISSIVLGFGLTNLFTTLKLPKTKWLLIFIQASLYWPFALQQIQNKLERISKDTTDAANLLSANKTDTIFRVLIPQCLPSIFVAFAFCFAISAGDASLPLIIGIPRFETLSLFTYRLAGQYRFAEACTTGSILMIFGIAVFIFGKRKE